MTYSNKRQKVFSNNKYFIQLDWVATPDVAKNHTVVKMDLSIWDKYGLGISTGSAQKQMYIKCNGENHQWTNTIAIGKKAHKWLGTWSKTIPHDANGNARITIEYGVWVGGVFDGKWTEWIKDSGSWNLQQIQRKSTLSNATLIPSDGGGWVFNINRASSSYHHTLYLDIQDGSAWPNIFGQTNVGATLKKNPNSDELLKYYKAMKGRMSAPCRTNLTTYSGSTSFGTTTKTGTASVMSSSVGKIASVPQNWAVTSHPTIGLKDIKTDKNYTYNIEFQINGVRYSKKGIRPFEGKTSGNYTFAFSQADVDKILTNMGNAKTGYGTFHIVTLYRGTQVGGEQHSGNSYVLIDPKLGSPEIKGKPVLYDSNAGGATTFSGSNKVFIQGCVDLTAKLPINFAMPRLKGKIVNVKVAAAGVDGNADYTDTSKELIVKLGKLLPANTVGNTPVTITVYDNRGFSASIVENINILQYKPPTIQVSGGRRYGYDSLIQLKLTVTHSTGTYGKGIVGLQQRAFFVSDLSTNKAIPPKGTMKIYNLNGKIDPQGLFEIPDLDNTKSFKIDVRISDGFKSAQQVITINEGRPILFIDSKRKSLGVNMFPTESNMIQLASDTVVSARAIHGFKSPKMAMIQDHLNGNTTLNGTGGSLYLGWENTANVRLCQNLYNEKTKHKLFDVTTNTMTIHNLFVGNYEGANANEGGMGHGVEIRNDATTPYIDFHNIHSDNDYDVRILSKGGNSNVGQGVLEINGGGGVEFNHQSVLRGNVWRIGPSGLNMYVCPKNGGWFMIKQNDYNGAWAGIQASKFEPKSNHSLKQNFKPLDKDEGLERIRQTDIVEYEYKDDPNVRLAGFIINDDGKSPFKTHPALYHEREFNGEKDFSYDVGNAIGTTMLAIKRLDEEVQELRRDNKNLRNELKSYKVLFENGVLTPNK